MIFLWKKSLDERDDDPSQETDEGIEQPQVEQADHDEESIRLDTGEEIMDFSWCEPHQDF